MDIFWNHTLLLLHPSPTDSRNTGAYVARPRPGYHHIKKQSRMRSSSSFCGSFRPTTVFVFSARLRYFSPVYLLKMNEETSKNVSRFISASFLSTLGMYLQVTFTIEGTSH